MRTQLSSKPTQHRKSKQSENL